MRPLPICACSSNRARCWALVILGFVLAHPLHLEPATIAMAGAALLLLLDNFAHSTERQSEQVHKTFGEVEWTTSRSWPP